MQSRRASAGRIEKVRWRCALQNIAAGVGVPRYQFSGELDMQSGGHRGRGGRRRAQHRDTGGWVTMDPDGARDWAQMELDSLDGVPGERDEEMLGAALFGPDSGYSIPPSGGWPRPVSGDLAISF